MYRGRWLSDRSGSKRGILLSFLVLRQQDPGLCGQGKIAPGESYAKVMSHEKEHVVNAVAEGNEKNKDLVSATVSLKTATCPECGRTYVSGGTTTTQIKYSDESNPYQQKKKLLDYDALAGQNVDAYA